MKTLCAALALALCLTGPVRAAEDPDAKSRAEVLAVVERFFDAMRAHDAEAWREIWLEGGNTFTQGYQPDGTVKLRQGSAKAMTEGLPTGPVMSERIWKPTVLVRGPMAVVWAPYEFQLEGKPHHCGIDVFDFVKVDGAWRMSNAMWTSEPKGCEALGAGKR